MSGGSRRAGSDVKPTDGPVSRLLNRPAARIIAGIIIRLGLPVTPNMVSMFSFLMAVSAGFMACLGMLVAAGIVAQLSSIMDGVDGILARRLRLASKAGGFLDTMLDRYADVSIYLGLGFYLGSSGVLEPRLAVALVAAAVSGDLLVSYLHSRGEKDLGMHPSLVGPLDSIASRDVRILLVSAGMVVGAPEAGLAAVALLSHMYVIVKSIWVYRLLAGESRI